MNELTEREQKLIGIIGKLISALTIQNIFYGKVYDLAEWRRKGLDSTGVTGEWLLETSKMLAEEFGMNYVILDKDAKVQE